MEFDIQNFAKACHPRKALFLDSDSDHKYYIDCSSVRGGDISGEIGRTITYLSPDEPTCQFLAGCSGYGKTVELLKLKWTLEQREFHVIYFKISADLELRNEVLLFHILLSISRHVLLSLKSIKIEIRSDFLTQHFPVIKTRSEKINIDIVNRVKGITTDDILKAINKELLLPGIQALKDQHKRGLVIIVDDLDRLDTKYIDNWRLHFTDPDERLRKLQSHVVYTVPLDIILSDDKQALKNYLESGIPPKILYAIPVKSENGCQVDEGISLLRQMLLVRAFPRQNSQKRLTLSEALFASSEILDQLCLMSGGRIKNLFSFLYQCFSKEDPPISYQCLEKVIKQYRNDLLQNITEDDLNFLYQVVNRQGVKTKTERPRLNKHIEKELLFEYYNDGERGFIINPVLSDIELRKGMKDFFISYNGADRNWAEWIAWILEESGYSVVIQAWDFRPGENFVLEMQEAAIETNKTIIILSNNYLNAKYTQSEWASAFRQDSQGRERLLVPIKVDNCEPNGLLGPLIYVDIVGLAEPDARVAVLGAFSERSKPLQAPNFPGTARKSSSTQSVGITQEPAQFPGDSSRAGIAGALLTKPTADKSSAVDRLLLMQTLNELPPPQLNMLLFTLNPPSGVIPPMPTPQGDRVFALLEWAKSSSGCGLFQVQELLQYIIQ